MTSFNDFDLHEQLLKSLEDLNYETPTPIQDQVIRHLTGGHDVLGIAQTGTGKTAAFALPTLDRLLRAPKRRISKQPRALILAPTRELALQIADSFRSYGQHAPIRTETVFGGVKITRQIRALEKGTDVLVATPGRLLDLMNQKAVSFEQLEVLVLDEADQMLDLGFIRDLTKIVAALPKDRQTMLFSATMPKQIEDLTQRYLRDPKRVSVTPAATTAERVRQSVIHVTKPEKLRLLEAVLRDPNLDRALVFVRTKHGANAVVRKLLAKGLKVEAIHGNKSQSQRVRTLNAFRDGSCPILVATDIAARGIDVDGVSHVINFEMPDVADQYVHRIGRTARAGREGLAISLVAEDELWHLRQVEKLAKITLAPMPAPEGCADFVLPTPDPNLRVFKPKGRSGNQSGGRRKSGGNHSQRKSKPNSNASTAPRPSRQKRRRRELA
ncbi:MAG: DEAD/DEAH box helicase [Pseudomonadota bacterium]